MKLINNKIIGFGLAMLLALPTYAGSDGDGEKAIKEKLSQAGMTVDSIKETPISGLYEVIVGTNLMYLSKDGRYLLQGDIVDIENITRPVNITTPVLGQIHNKILDALGEDQMFVFAPEKVEHTITVFTDLDCSYCRKLHSELDQYLAKGVKVRYLMYPRSGPNTQSYFKAVAAWCAEDRNKSLTMAKLGKDIEMKKCDNPVDEHMKLANAFHLRGTPMIIMEDGEILRGYVPASKLIQKMNQGD